MKPNALKEKSMDFAILIVKTCQKIQSQKKEYILSKQLIRSGTAIGALYCEAQHAESNKDFIHKLSIAQKECNETIYWLTLLARTDYIDLSESLTLKVNAEELIKLLTSIIKTMKNKSRE